MKRGNGLTARIAAVGDASSSETVEINWTFGASQCLGRVSFPGRGGGIVGRIWC